MADVGPLDFREFVRVREHPFPDGGRASAVPYAYGSDHTTRMAFDQLAPVEAAVAAAVRVSRAFGRSQLLGQAVKVGPRQFPRVHGIATECAGVLGIAPPTVYIVNSPVMNAATFGTNDDSFIMVHSALVDHFSDDELRSVIGHECGHIHNKHVVYLTAMSSLARIAGLVFSWVIYPAQAALMGWLRRAEITCDRASLLCSKSLDVSTRALTKLALGSSKLYDQLDMDAFLEQYEEARSGIGSVAEINASHPFLPKRVLALRVFAESALYRRHAGLGEGGLSIDEVDERVHEIIRVVG